MPLPFTTRARAAGLPADREIVFGQSAVLSGPLGNVALSVNSGAKLAIDAANAAGGIHGRMVRILSLDDELKPARTLANFRTLQDEHHVFGYFSAVGTANIGAVTPFLQEAGAPLIGGYGVADRVRQAAAGMAYIVRAGYAREVERIVQHLTSIGITRIAVAHLATPGGEDILANVRTAIRARDASHDVAGSAGIQLDGANAGEAGKAIAAGRPQAVVIFAGGAPVATFIQSVQENGAKPLFYGMSSVPGDVVARTLGTRLQSGLAVAQVVPYPWSDSDPVAREFRQRAAKAGTTINYYAFEGYFNALLLLEALHRAGRGVTRASMHAVMRSFKGKFGAMDLDFTTPGSSGSQLVELVHVTTSGRFIR